MYINKCSNYYLLFKLLVVLISIMVISGCGKTPDNYSGEAALGEQPIVIQDQSSYETIDLFVIIDQSGSMSDANNPTDPTNKRISATESLIYSIMLKSDPMVPHLLGVISFGTDVPEEYVVPLSPLKAEDDATDISSELKPLNLGWTNFIDALKRAERGFIDAGTYDSNRKPVIIIFTDGEPDDVRRLTLDEYFIEINDYLQDSLSDVEIYLVAIDITGDYWPQSEIYWSEILSESNIFQLDDMDDLTEKYNLIIRNLLGIDDIPPELVTAQGLEFEVLPYLDAMEILPFPANPDLELLLIKPDGRLLELDHEDVYVRELMGGKIIWIEKPEPGIWRYEIEQKQGEITVYRNQMPADVRLFFPLLDHPVGKESELVAYFTYRDGSVVESSAEYPLNLFVELISPNGTEQTMPLNESSNGLYRSVNYLKFPSRGSYLLSVIVRGGDRYVYRRSFNLNAIDHPYLIIEEPANRATVDLVPALNVKVRPYFQGETIDPGKYIKGPPESMALIQMVSLIPENEAEELHWLKTWSDEGYWTITLPFAGESGTFYLIARLVGELRATDEEIVVDSFSVFNAQPSIWTTFKNVIAYIALGIVILLALFTLYLFVWFSKLPQLKGRLIITVNTGQTIIINLLKKRLVIQRIQKKGIGNFGYIVVYTYSKKIEYILIRWSKKRFLHTIRLRRQESRSLGKVEIKFE